MKAELISIGDELLIGQTINTNASWLGQLFSANGIAVHRVISISDSKQEIMSAVREAMDHADLVVITGGLGPTKDDITKHTLCEFFNTRLVIHIPTLRKIEEFFMRRNRPMLESNIRQAELPEQCTILENNYGTAAGMLFEYEGKLVVSLPGVPYEMKGIVTEQLLPLLSKRYSLKSIYHKTLLTQGIGESFLAERLADWENRVRSEGFGLAYLPSPGMVKLRITSQNGEQDEPRILGYFSELKEALPQYVYGEGEVTLSEVIGKLLKSSSMSLGTVESCTGGSLAQEIVSVSGASDYFQGSLITYSNALKTELAGVLPASLSDHGAVSAVVAEEMAAGGREKLGVDICVATTGIAGPTGGSEEKPVGTVYIAVSTKERTVSRCFSFGDQRERNIRVTVLTALNLLRCELLGISFEKK